MPRLGTGRQIIGLIPYGDAESEQFKGGNMEYEELRAEVRKEFYAPFYDVAKDIVDPMVKRIKSAIYFKKINPEDPITWNEAFKINWAWGQVMEHESEIRPILAEVKELIG